ncbi:MAG: hypothetical protein M3P50_10460, partial [Actinomycetota bacterium]|nr:hypothetical protein [Actinomycetota bacterium]
HHVGRHRARLHQQTRELRASTRRILGDERARAQVRLQTVARRADASALAARRGQDLDRLARLLAAHDPQRTLERGYALIESPAGEPVTSAAAAGEHDALVVRLHDGRVEVRRAPPSADLPLF